MKDQPTEASVNPFNMGRIEGPTGRLNPLAHVLPFTVKQRNRRIKRKGCFGVRLERLNRQNQHESCVCSGDVASAEKGRFEKVHRVHAPVGVATVRRVENEASNGTLPRFRQEAMESRRITSHHTSVVRFTSACPHKVRLSAVRHFRIEVDAQRRSTAKGRFDQEATRPRHGVHHRARADGSSGQIDR